MFINKLHTTTAHKVHITSIS